MGLIKGKYLVLVLTEGTYEELVYIEHFSLKMCQNF